MHIFLTSNSIHTENTRRVATNLHHAKNDDDNILMSIGGDINNNSTYTKENHSLLTRISSCLRYTKLMHPRFKYENLPLQMFAYGHCF